MNTTSYTQEDLRKIALDAFKMARQEDATCVGGKWYISVSNSQVVLVLPLSIKDGTGTWRDTDKRIVL